MLLRRADPPLRPAPTPVMVRAGGPSTAQDAKSDFEIRPHKLKGKRLTRPGTPKTFGSRRN